MDNMLIRLKKLLNTYKDKELKEIDLWVNNSENIEIIGIDDTAISLITDTELLKIDGKDW